MTKNLMINTLLILIVSGLMMLFKTEGYYSSLLFTNPFYMLATVSFIACPLGILSVIIIFKEWKIQKKIWENILFIFLTLSSIALTLMVPLSSFIFLSLGWFSTLLLIFIPTATTAITFIYKIVKQFKKKPIELKTELEYHEA